MKKELLRLEESPEEDIHLDSLRIIPKKVQKWKTPGHDSMGLRIQNLFK